MSAILTTIEMRELIWRLSLGLPLPTYQQDLSTDLNNTHLQTDLVPRFRVYPADDIFFRASNWQNSSAIN